MSQTSGGLVFMRNGPYILIIAPENYPGKKYRGRYIYEHHFVYWKTYGITPKKDEIVHHKNGIKTDNRVENLELLNEQEHRRHHGKEKKEKAERIHLCSFCKQEFKIRASNLNDRIKANKRGVYCSKKCADKANSSFALRNDKELEKTCLYCNKKFKRRYNDYNKYCSRNCYRNSVRDRIMAFHNTVNVAR